MDISSLEFGPAQMFAIGVLLAWLAGIRVYLTVFGVGLAGLMDWVSLPEALQATESPWVLGVSGVLALVEFFTDKIPGVDSIWDLLQTLARVPAGAFLAAAAMSPDGSLSPGVLTAGAGVALTSHLIKTGTRAIINTSPEPASNWTASLGGDALTIGGLSLVFAYPWLALTLVLLCSVVFALSVWWLGRKAVRGMRWLFGRGGRDAPPPGSDGSATA